MVKEHSATANWGVGLGIVLALGLLPAGCRREVPPPPSQAPRALEPVPAMHPASQDCGLPARWTPSPVAKDEVNLLIMGDWGSNSDRQKAVAKTMAEHVARSGRPWNGAILAGDNFYVSLKSTHDPYWKKLFEEMYDAAKLNFPFYAVLGNHDYGGGKDRIELAYAAEHPRSRFKMLSRWYRLDLPQEEPIVTILMLDSDRSTMPADQWQKQLEWINRELADRRAKWVFCIAHHTLWSNGSHGDSGTLQKQWGEVFARHKVDFYFCGHDHSLQHLQIKDQPTTYVVAGGGGASRTSMKRADRGPFSRKLYGFADVQVRADQVSVKLIDGLEGTLVHHFTRGAGGNVAVVKTTPSDAVAAVALRPAGAPPSPISRAMAATGLDEYEVMPDVLMLEGAALERFQESVAQRNEGYLKWSQGERGLAYAAAAAEYDQARRRKDAAAVAAAEKKYKPLRAEQEAARKDLRRRFNRGLDLDHLRRWAGHQLYEAVNKQFAPAGLTGEQQQQAYVVCFMIAAQSIDAAAADRDPYLTPTPAMRVRAAEVIRELVLNSAQKQKMPPVQPAR